MEGYYLAVVVLLFALAILDLVVGVSNDAVNFLNSAIGSRVATKRTILIIASLGVLLGAMFSSGMMEIARKGVFNPVYFNMEEITVLFLAVMITDILLLDVFNSLALPTSTTVSIVFELLGASLCLALIKMGQDPESALGLSDYLNIDSAVTIISGIFLSVGIAFSVGIGVMYVSRLLFTFNFNRQLRLYGSVFAGFAITSIAYFTLIKGLKGSSFVTADQLTWVKENTSLLLLWSFVGWTALVQLLNWLFKVNQLKVVVLAGTFSLAMAFAGNDLVNFIGVPVTGFQSYLNYIGQDLPAHLLMMDFLSEPVRTPTYLLVISGVVMVLTLWFSGKARKVTETEVNLGRQEDGDERFAPNLVSRGLVGASLSLGQLLTNVLPVPVVKKLEKRFEPLAAAEADPPAFDLVRASVNLMVASILIAAATSLKLPLSTTYVSFMVAMGTSLADRAWGRESAVYRVAGVLNVILGWFVTAVVALAASALIALLLFYFGFYGALILFTLAIVALIRSHVAFRKREKEQARALNISAKAQSDLREFLQLVRGSTLRQLEQIRQSYSTTLHELPRQKRSAISKAHKQLLKVEEEVVETQIKNIKTFRKLKKGSLEAAMLYLRVLDLVEDICQSATIITGRVDSYVKNHHKPLKESDMKPVLDLEKGVSAYLKSVQAGIEKEDFSNFGALNEERKKLQAKVDALLAELVEDAHSKDISAKHGSLLMSILLETKDLLAAHHRIMTLYRDYSVPSVPRN